MNHAYLILAHNQPELLGRLVRALECEGAAFFVHVDKKCDLAPFASAVEGSRNVSFVELGRVEGMGFSAVEATLRLMRAARDGRFDYFTLLSGSDYPIKSNQHIVERLSNSTTEFLNYWRLEDRPSWQHKVHYHYPIEWIPIRDYRQTKLRRLFWGTFLRVRHFFPKRTFPEGYIPWGGSQWWSLTGTCIDYVLDFLDGNPAFVRFYRTTHSADEMFFQTIIMNSPFAARAANFEIYERWRAQAEPWKEANLEIEKRRMIPHETFNLRYIDWSEEFSGRREAPVILDERDYESLSRSECLFARKVDPLRSQKLLALIDRCRGGAAEEP